MSFFVKLLTNKPNFLLDCYQRFYTLEISELCLDWNNKMLRFIASQVWRFSSLSFFESRTYLILIKHTIPQWCKNYFFDLVCYHQGSRPCLKSFFYRFLKLQEKISNKSSTVTILFNVTPTRISSAENLVNVDIFVDV